MLTSPAVFRDGVAFWMIPLKNPLLISSSHGGRNITHTWWVSVKRFLRPGHWYKSAFLNWWDATTFGFFPLGRSREIGFDISKWGSLAACRGNFQGGRHLLSQCITDCDILRRKSKVSCTVLYEMNVCDYRENGCKTSVGRYDPSPSLWRCRGGEATMFRVVQRHELTCRVLCILF